MTKKIWRGYMVTETDTRVTMRPINTEDKYAYVLAMCAHISGCTEAQVDAKITEVMERFPCS